MESKSRPALILAHHDHGEHPLALIRTGGIPNLKRILLSLHRKNIERFVVVCGKHERVIRSALAEDPSIKSLDLSWLDSDAALSDGQALLTARPHLDEAFILVQGDRVFTPALLKGLELTPGYAATLIVERCGEKPSSDGLGLRLEGDDRVAGVASEKSDAIWTGLAVCDDSLLAELEADRNDDGSLDLTNSIARMAGDGKIAYKEAPANSWQTLKTAGDQRKADRLLLNALRKPETDGPIARTINRPFSLFITRLLMNTSVRPNQVTILNLLVSIAAGVLAALATQERPWFLALGALGWQLASMLDGTDGELARLKFQTSKYGEWLDTIVDDTGRTLVFLGTGWGLSVITGNPFWFRLMLVTIAMQAVVTVRIYTKLKMIGAGSHFALAWTTDRSRPLNPTIWYRFWQQIEFMSRRDYYIFLFLIINLTGLYRTGVYLAFITSGIVFFHEMCWPRKPRDQKVVENVLMRDDEGSA